MGRIRCWVDGALMRCSTHLPHDTCQEYYKRYRPPTDVRLGALLGTFYVSQGVTALGPGIGRQQTSGAKGFRHGICAPGCNSTGARYRPPTD